jgi:hypothetical protein
MTIYQDPMFWHDLWFGLTCLGDKNYTDAHIALSKVKIRNQIFNKKRQSEPKVISYNHPRR